MGNVYEHRGHPSIKGGMYSKVAFWKNQLDHSGRWWRPQIKITKIIAQKLKPKKKVQTKKGASHQYFDWCRWFVRKKIRARQVAQEAMRALRTLGVHIRSMVVDSSPKGNYWKPTGESRLWYIGGVRRVRLWNICTEAGFWLDGRA